MMLSIVTTLYKSSPTIGEFYERICAAVKQITEDYEIIFVNDGSPDDSLAQAVAFHHRDKNIKVIDLSRNFGHHKAIMAGLTQSKGEYVFLIDSDLEESPELLVDFWLMYQKDQGDTDVVYGVQTARKGRFGEKVSGSLFFHLFNFLSDTKLTNNVSVVRLMSRQFVDNLLSHTEKEQVFAGLCELTGFNQKPAYFTKHNKGSSAYDFNRKLRMAIGFVTAFSSKPLHYIFYLGIGVMALSTIVIIYLLVNKLLHDVVVEGWTAVVVSIWLVAGLIMFSIGVVGIYLSQIFNEVKGRPNYIIKNVYGDDG